MSLPAQEELAPRPGSLAEGLRRLGELPAAALRARLADDLVSHYSGVSEDEGVDLGTREAAMLLVVANSHLHEQEADEALKAGQDALELYRGKGDASGAADAVLTVVRAQLLRGETAQASELVGAKLAESTGSAAEACLLLASAEVRLEERRPEEALRQCKEALAKGDKRMQARALLVSVNAHIMSDHWQDAPDAAKAAIALFQETGDLSQEAGAWHTLATVHILYEAPEDASEAGQKSLTAFQSLEDERNQAMVLNTLAVAQLELEDSSEAQRLASEASALSRRASYARGEIEAVQTLVLVQQERGGRQEALQLAREGVAWAQRSGSRRAETLALEMLAQAHLAGREPEGALRAGWEAMEIQRALGGRAHGEALLRVALLHLVNSQEDWALEAAQEAEELLTSLGDRRGEARAQFARAHVHLQKGETGEALAATQRAERLFREAHDRRWMAHTLLAASAVHRAAGDSKYAVAAAQRAMGFFEDAHDRRGAASASLAMAEVHFNTGSFERALRASRRALGMLERIGHMRSQAVALHMVAGAYLSANQPNEAARFSTEMRELCKKVQDKRGEGHAMHLLTRANIGHIWREVDNLEQYKPKDAEVAEEEGEEEEKQLTYGGIPGQSTQNREAPETKDPRYEKAKVQHEKILEVTDKALAIAKEGVSVAKKSDDRELQGVSLYSLGQIQLLSGAGEEALKSAKEALKIAQDGGEQFAEALALILSAEVHMAAQNSSEAVEAAEHGLRLCRRIGDVPGEDYAKKVLEQLLGQPAPGSDDADDGGAASDAMAVSVGLDPSFVRAELRDQVSQLIGVDDGDMGDDTPLMDSGMDSLSSVEFRNTVAKEFKMNLPATLTFDFPSVKAITEYIVEQSRADTDAASGGGGGGGGAGRSALRSGISKPKPVEPTGNKVRRPCISGTWDNWAIHEMDYDSKARCYQVSIRLGRNNWESFQILYDADWNHAIYPSEKDASPHATHKLLGPDEDGAGKNWTVGLHPTDKGGEGVCFQIKLMLTDEGNADKVDWVRLGTGVQDVLESTKASASAAKHLPYIVGTMNNWGEPKVMTWDAAGQHFRYKLTIGRQGWESFQIVYNGEWRRCLHPDRKDGCPHSHYQLMGPDMDGDGKNWTIGKHPLDKGGEGNSYIVRLFLKGGEEGIARSVDWVSA